MKPQNCVPINHDGKIIDPLVRRRVNAYVEQLRRMTELVHTQEIEIAELRAKLKALDGQKPVAEKSENGIEWQYANTVHDMPVGTKLYTQAKPVVPEWWNLGLVKEAVISLKQGGMDVSLCSALEKMLAAAPQPE